MATRTSIKSVIFTRPFTLGESDEVLPAGSYSVETDEEMLEGISFVAYRHVLTLLHVKSSAAGSVLSRTLKIDPRELSAALLRDRMFVGKAVGVAPPARQVIPG